MQKNNNEIIEEFRAKLKAEGRNLKWFHEHFVTTTCTYSYLVRQLHIPAELKSELIACIKDYMDNC